MSSPADGPIRVLHVDDESEFAELTGRFLERETDRFAVETATGAGSALERIDEEPAVDCVVSDYDMPGTDGIELLRSVRETHPDLPFLLFTGKGSEAVASEAISAGVTDYLQKGAGTEQYTVLANRIENAVDRHRAERLVDRAFDAMDDSREGIAMIDEDGTFAYVNGAYARILGYDRAELVGEPWTVVFPEERAERVREEILGDDPDGGRWTDDAVYRRKDGERVPVDHVLACSERGRVVCLLHDRTGADERERLLRRERQRFDLFVDAVEDCAIVMLDPDGYVATWNGGAERILGYAENEILGDHASAFYTEAQREAGLPESLLERALDEGRVDHRGRRVRADGSTFHADVALTAVYDDDGDHRGFATVLRDVSDEVERDREREADERYRERLYRIASDPSLDTDRRIVDLLELGCERLGVENGHVVRVDREAGRHEVIAASGSDLVEAGDVTDLSRTYCRETVESEEPMAVHDAPAEGRGDDPAYRTWGIGCYLGGKLQVRDRLFGTVCFADRSGREEPFTGLERSFVDLLARSVGHALERREHAEDRQLWTRAIEAAPIGITLADATREDNPLTYVNGTFEALTGYSAAAVRGRNCRFLQGRDTDADTVAEMRAAIDDREPVTVELRNYRSDGTAFWNRVSIAPVEGDDGTVTHFVGFQQDVTDAKERAVAIEALHDATRESIAAGSETEIAETVVDAATELLHLPHTGVHLYDEGADGLVPVSWTETATETIGEPPTLGHDSLAWDAFEAGETSVYADLETVDGVHNPDTPLRSELVAPLGRHGVVVVGSTERDAFDHDDRQLVELLAANATAALDRVHREEMLRQRERELERRNEQLEKFASVVSHDLRNPLTVADGRVALAREECDSDHLADAAGALDRMDRLIDDLLSLARQGDRVREMEPVDLAGLARTCWRTVGTGEATLVVETDRTIRADRSRLRQLLENLFRNAVEHGSTSPPSQARGGPTDPEAGTVTITVGDVEGASGSGFYVADDGPGIPAGERERVFESGVSGSHDGTGFGLAIVREIAEAHGWSVSVTDSAAGGARFEVTGVEPA